MLQKNDPFDHSEFINPISLKQQCLFLFFILLKDSGFLFPDKKKPIYSNSNDEDRSE